MTEAEERSSARIANKSISMSTICLRKSSAAKNLSRLKLEEVYREVRESVYNFGICDSDSLEFLPCSKVNMMFAENGEMLAGRVKGDMRGCRRKTQLAGRHRWWDIGDTEWR